MYDILFYYFPGYHQTLFRIYFQQNIAAMLRQRSTAHGNSDRLIYMKQLLFQYNLLYEITLYHRASWLTAKLFPR